MKWNKFISYMWNCGVWFFVYCFKFVDGFVFGWSLEWFFYFLFLFVGVEWFDISFYQYKRIGELVKDEVIDYLDWILFLLVGIGFKYEVEDDVVRIWGYLFKCYDYFLLIFKGYDVFWY